MYSRIRGMIMDPIEVGCAIIHKKGRLLIAQRHLHDSFGGYWEFPGGKREQDETIEACLVREVREELGVRIRPGIFFRNRTHGTSERKLSLCFFFCAWESGEPRSLDCKDFKWVSREDIRHHSWLPGDWEVVKDLLLHWDAYFKT